MSSTRFAFHSGKSKEMKTYMFEQMLHERKRVFIDKMEWDLEIHNEMEVDQFDDSDTMYIIVSECNIHAASLRIHKRNLNQSLMSVISNNYTESNHQVWEISGFFSSNYSLGTAEYLLLYLAYTKFIELGVQEAYATLNVSTARLFRLLGIDIKKFTSLNCEVKGCQNYTISTNLSAFERFYRRIPARDAAVLRAIGERHEGKFFNPLSPTIDARKSQRTGGE